MTGLTGLCVSLVALMGCANLFNRDTPPPDPLPRVTELRAKAIAADASWYDATAFGSEASTIKRLVDEKRAPATWFDDAQTALERFNNDQALSDENRAYVEEALGDVFAIQDKMDWANIHYYACVLLDPDSLEKGAGMPRCWKEITDPERKVKACKPIRSTLDLSNSDHVRKFVDLMNDCLAAADQDESKLKWGDVESDLAFYREVLAARSGGGSAPDSPPADDSGGDDSGSRGKYTLENGEKCRGFTDCKSKRCIDSVCVKDGKSPHSTCSSTAECRGDLVCGNENAYGTALRCMRQK